MNNKIFITFFLSVALLMLYSCSSTKLVVHEYNRFVNNICKEGIITYYASSTTSRFDSIAKKVNHECKFSSNFIKLNEIIPNTGFKKESCEFVVTFDYLTKMQKYLEENKRDKKIVILDLDTYRDTLYYFDSIQMVNWLNKN